MNLLKSVFNILGWTIIYVGLPYWIFLNTKYARPLVYGFLIFFALIALMLYIGGEINNHDKEELE